MRRYAMALFCSSHFLALEDEREEMLVKLNSKRGAASHNIDLVCAVVVNKRQAKNFKCSYCDYVSRAQYRNALHIARIHEVCIEPQNCELLRVQNDIFVKSKAHLSEISRQHQSNFKVGIVKFVVNFHQ